MYFRGQWHALWIARYDLNLLSVINALLTTQTLAKAAICTRSDNSKLLKLKHGAKRFPSLFVSMAKHCISIVLS